MIFSTDDFWCLDMMKKNSSRMRVLSVYDLAASETVIALRHLRKHALKFRYPALQLEDIEIEDDGVLKRVFDLVGGRMSHLTRVVRADDMLSGSEWCKPMTSFTYARGGRSDGRGRTQLAGSEDRPDSGTRRRCHVCRPCVWTTQLMTRDEQKWSSCSWLLLRHLAKMCPSLEDGVEPGDDFEMPSVSYSDARRIMTRTDFLDPLDAFQVSRDVAVHCTGLTCRS